MTPAYAAPEQLRGGRRRRYRLYSLGVVLYELLTGPPAVRPRRSPREAERPCRRAGAGRGRRWRPETRRAGPLVGAGRRLGRSRRALPAAMRADPARRYRSVDALVRDIDHLPARRPARGAPRHGRLPPEQVRPPACSPVTAGAGGLLHPAAACAQRGRCRGGRARSIQRFMLRLFQGGEETWRRPTAARGDAARARRAAGGLTHRPPVQAELYPRSAGSTSGSASSTGRLADRRGAPRACSGGRGGGDRWWRGGASDQARFESGALAGGGLAARALLPAGHPLRAATAPGPGAQERGRYDQAMVPVGARWRCGRGAPSNGGAPARAANAHFYAGHLDRRALNRRTPVTTRWVTHPQGRHLRNLATRSTRRRRNVRTPVVRRDVTEADGKRTSARRPTS